MSSFKDFERTAWEAKASRYSDTWGTVTSQINDTILDEVRDKTGGAFLDLGCGPGHLTAKAKAVGFKAIGGDYSTSMIEIASRNYPDMQFVQTDAEAIHFAGETFDVVVMNYLLLHVADQQKALLEGKRILKPGGKLIYTNWVSPQSSPGLKLIFDALKEYADMSVIPPAQDIFMFSDFTFAKKFFEDAEFSAVSSKIFDSAWHFQSGEKFFEAVQAGTRMGGLIDLQNTEIKDKIKAKMIKDIEAFRLGIGYKVPTPSILVCATV